MRIYDAHVHASWKDGDGATDFLKELDEAGLEGSVVLSPAVEHAAGGPSPAAQRESIDFVARFVSASPDRLIPFAHIVPQVEGAADAVRYAKDKGCRGVKMLPNHWYPYDKEVAFPVYEAAQETGLPILFHSGILFAFEDSSRFCRPVYYEALLHFPKVKFALAHISWPWTDECIATWGRMSSYARKEGLAHQMFIDCTPGTPRFYRSEAMERAVKYCSCDWLIFGTDCSVSSKAHQFTKTVQMDDGILGDEVGLPEAERAKFFSGNLMRLLGDA